MQGFYFINSFNIYVNLELKFYMWYIRGLGITAMNVKLRKTGGNMTKTPGLGAQSALRALSRSRMKIGRSGKQTSIFVKLSLLWSPMKWNKTLIMYFIQRTWHQFQLIAPVERVVDGEGVFDLSSHTVIHMISFRSFALRHSFSYINIFVTLALKVLIRSNTYSGLC